MKSLGARLEAVADMIHTYGPFSCLADIGSDHAWIAVRTLQNGDAACCVASDLHEGPLKRGQEHAKRAGVAPVFRLSDGFDALGDCSFDAACICGMGGELIADILRRYGTQPQCLLLLQPMTRQEELRQFLWDSGYTIEEERYVCERNRPYAILAARYTGAPTDYTYSDLFLGRLRPDTAAFRAYAAKIHTQAEKRRQGLSARGENTAKEDRLLAELQKILPGG